MDAFSRLAAMSALLGTAASLQGQPKVIYVDVSAPAGGDGTTWTHACRDLAGACSIANESVFAQGNREIEIRIAQGTYRATPDRVRHVAAFEVGRDPSVIASGISVVNALKIGIFGGFAGRRSTDPDQRDVSAFASVLSADVNGDDGPGFSNRVDNADSVMACWIGEQGACSVDGLTFSGGDVSHSFQENNAGGLSIHASGPNSLSRVTRCRFIDNAGWLGGGLAALGGGADVIDCAFIGNRAGALGGGYAGGWSEPFGTVRRCTFEGNSARDGGAAVSVASFQQCRFIENVASGDGGAILLYGDYKPFPAHQNCLFAGNEAGGLGGAIAAGVFHATNPSVIQSCTFVQNRAAWGGAIHAYESQISSSILWGNVAVIAGSQISQAEGGLFLSNCLVQGGASGIYRVFGGRLLVENIIDADPRFVDSRGPDGMASTVADNNYRLSIDSPCIDRGSPFSPLDLDGLSRVERGPSGVLAEDLGCYEWRQICPADFDNSGGTPDMTDLAAFFEAFSAGDAAADVNKSGGTPDSDDIEAFFNVWLAGGC